MKNLEILTLVSQYIDPESHTVRSYYSDFLFQKEDGSYVIVEVKGDDKIEDLVVQAKKEFAEQLASANGMKYKMIKASNVNQGDYDFLLNGHDYPTQTTLTNIRE